MARRGRLASARPPRRGPTPTARRVLIARRSILTVLGWFAATRLLCLVGLTLGGRRAAGGGDVGASLLAGAWHWDAHWYAGIALQGYSHTSGTGSNVAYFPATPTLMAWGERVIGHPIAAGMILSVVESAVAVLVVTAVMARVVGDEAATRGTVLLLTWPAAVFLVLPYADALLLLAGAITFALAQRGRFVTAGLAGAVGALTRSTGAFLAVPLFLFICDRHRRLDRRVALAGLVGLGTAAYAVGLWITFGQPLAFAAAESAGWHRVALPPPLPVAWTVARVLTSGRLVFDRPDLVFTDLLDLTAVAMVAVALWRWRRDAAAPYLAWPAVGLLWPLLTGTTSVARYVIVLFPVFALIAARLSTPLYRAAVAVSTVALAAAAYTFGAGGWIG